MIYLVIGLPGSGKTTFLKTVEGTVVDDIASLEQLPDEFENLWISDINFCLGTDSAEKYLKNRYKDEKIIKIFFKNSPSDCIMNIKNRNDGRNISDNFVYELSKRYVIPDNQEVKDVRYFRESNDLD